MHQLNFEEILGIIKTLQQALEIERLCPVVVRMHHIDYNTLLMNERFEEGNQEEVFGLKIRTWDEEYIQVETEARFGRFARGHARAK